MKRTDIRPGVFTLEHALSAEECEATLFEDAEVLGCTGMALVFRHALLHEGATVIVGRKYALRSDVMYGPR